jgi:hypothetical protein
MTCGGEDFGPVQERVGIERAESAAHAGDERGAVRLVPGREASPADSEEPAACHERVQVGLIRPRHNVDIDVRVAASETMSRSLVGVSTASYYVASLPATGALGPREPLQRNRLQAPGAAARSASG